MPLAIAFVAAILLAVVAVVALIRTGRRADRFLSLLALLASLTTLVVATWQNQVAASAAAQTLMIEEAPALVINCHLGADGKEDQVFPLTPNNRYEFGITQPWPKERLVDYETCVVRNFGRQPALVAALPITYQFYRVVRPGKAVVVGTKTRTIFIDGIAPQGSYWIWIANKSVRQPVNVITPQSVTFIEPSQPRQRMKYVFPRFEKYAVTVLNPVHLPPGALSKPLFRGMP